MPAVWSHLQHLITNIPIIHLPFDKFSNKEIPPAKYLQLVSLFMSHKAGLNYNVPVVSTITFTGTIYVLMCINFSLHRNDTYLFVGWTEVMFVTTVFGALVRLRPSPFWNNCCIFNNYIFLSSKFCFPSHLLCSRRFQIITEHIPHKNSRSETTDLNMSIDTTDRVGNTTDIVFSLRRSKKCPPHTKV
jgi:hypothetical protein